MITGSTRSMRNAQGQIRTTAHTTSTSEECATLMDIAGRVGLIPWDDTMAAENSEIRQMTTRIRPPKQTEWEAAWRTSPITSSFDKEWSHG